MPHSHETHPLDDELLRTLWSRRRDLDFDQSDWARLYTLVTSSLANYRPQELASLPEGRDIYVANYFQDKVLRTDLQSSCDHLGALRHYFRNYLRDELRSLKAKSEREVAGEQDPLEENRTPQGNAPISDPVEPDDFDSLKEAGIEPVQVAESARRFLSSSDEWVRLYLGLSYCQDKELSEPLSRLAGRKGINSWHYKAKQLGFNWDGETYVGFSKTMLGQWLTIDVGIDIRPDSKQMIRGALKILCFEALSWVEQQEAFL